MILTMFRTARHVLPPFKRSAGLPRRRKANSSRKEKWMLRAMDSAVAGLRAHQNKLDVIGHNIANVNTFGFKSQVYSFQEAMYQTTSPSTGGSSNAGGTNAAQFGYGSLMGTIATDMTASTPTYVGGLNASINGDGFFVTYPSKIKIDNPNDADSGIKGQDFDYTRVGQFKLDSNGYLVDGTGNFVYGFQTEYGQVGQNAADKDFIPKESLEPLRAPAAYTKAVPPAAGATTGGSDPSISFEGDHALEVVDIQIDKLGRLTAKIKHQDDPNADEKDKIDGQIVTLGWVAVATFQNPEGLTKKGGYYYGATDGDNTGSFSVTQPGGSTSDLMTGYLEASNVDLAQQFSDMITTQRGFQANSKLITVSDEVLNELVNMKR